MQNLTKQLTRFTLNGRPVAVMLDPSRPLLKVLREDFGLTGTKQSCDMEGECGACTVIVDGSAQRSCLILAGELDGRVIETIEGIGEPEHPHPVQTAFLQAGAVQCGYCTPGMIMSAKALLDRNNRPTSEEIVEALAGNICRCTGYPSIIRAVGMAAAELRGDPPPPGAVSAQSSEVRHDGWPRVSGAARFAEDIVMPDMLHMALVRCPHFHARVLNVDITAALRSPGVVRVLTATDIPGENGLGGYSVGEPLLVAMGDEARMRGDPAAMVIATDLAAAEQGASLVHVEYEVLPHTLETTDAFRMGTDSGEQILAEYAFQTGDLDAVLRSADTAIEAVYETAAQAHMGMEREAALAYIEPESNVLTVIGGSHEPHWSRGYLAQILGLSVEQIRVITPPIGGSFGARQDVAPLALAALGAYHVRRPVRLAYSRREVMDAGPKRHAYRMKIHIAARKDGVDAAGPQLSAMKTEMVANTGAHDSGGRYIAEYAVTASAGAYRWEAVQSHARVLYTNAAKAGQFRGFGTPQPVLALECGMDELCERLGVDPLSFRLQNIVAPGEPLALGYPPGETLGYRECLEALRPDYEAMLARVEDFNADAKNAGRRRGVGIAGMMYRFGKFGAPRSQAEVELDMEGRITLYTSAADYGQGIETTFLRLASDVFGIERDALRIVNADTQLTKDGDVAGASRATYWVGSSLVDACRRLQQAMLDGAVEILDMSPDALIWRRTGGAIEAAGIPDRVVSFAELAQEMARLNQPRRITGRLDLSAVFREHSESGYLPLFLTGAHAAEIEVDLATGQTRCLHVSAAHDVGKVINRRDATGQVEGGVMMGLGSALMEEFVSGRTLGFSTYHVPTALALPEIRTYLVEVRGRYAAFGVKGLGEATFLPTAPAILNGISRAVGVRIRRTPATGEYVLSRMAEGRL